jgi:hypothetical protein
VICTNRIVGNHSTTSVPSTQTSSPCYVHDFYTTAHSCLPALKSSGTVRTAETQDPVNPHSKYVVTVVAGRSKLMEGICSLLIGCSHSADANHRYPRDNPQVWTPVSYEGLSQSVCYARPFVANRAGSLRPYEAFFRVESDLPGWHLTRSHPRDAITCFLIPPSTHTTRDN